ncbi:MAG TPA: TIGR01777 family protein [bacterium]|nr:TIGR01777 family protein [bacterium]
MPRRVAITGSSGLVGRALVASLRADGHAVVRMVRTPGAATGDDIARWDPATGDVDLTALGNPDAVVHLAGENIAAGRWTAARRRRIRDSRGPATLALCRTLARLPRPLPVMVSASGVGIYGDRGDEWLTETSPPGPDDDFLTAVAKEWEAATAPLAERDTRVVTLRIGVVLAREGGALPRMLPPFRLGLGGRLGSGHHYVSWITLADLTRVIRRAIDDDDLRGPIHAVSPTPVDNREFTRTLARVLRRPAVLPVPRGLLHLLFGGFADVLLASQRARPQRLLDSGFRFEHEQLEHALRSVLGC